MGRDARRVLIEACRVISIRQLRAVGLLQAGRWVARVEWPCGLAVEVAGYIGAHAGHLRITVAQLGPYDARPRFAEQHVDLEAVPQPFGGVTWRFLCPRTGERCRRLLAPPGTARFGSRAAWGRALTYGSKRRDPLAQAITRAHALRSRLDAEADIGGRVRRPRGMHRATFARHRARLDRAEARADQLLGAALARIGMRV
jgi:hypothetical protein